MKWDDITPGEQWLIETLDSDSNLRGWAMRRIELDETRGHLHVSLTDRYGRTYRYHVIVEPEL